MPTGNPIIEESAFVIARGGYLSNCKSIKYILRWLANEDLRAALSCTYTAHHNMEKLYQPPCMEVEDFRTDGLLCDSYNGAGLDDTYDDTLDL